MSGMEVWGGGGGGEGWGSEGSHLQQFAYLQVQNKTCTDLNFKMVKHFSVKIQRPCNEIAGNVSLAYNFKSG